MTSKFQSNLKQVLKVSRECSYPERLHKYSGRSRVIRGWKEGGAGLEGGREGGRKGGADGREKRRGPTGVRGPSEAG